MPKAGMDMKEGKIVKWIAEVGQKVAEGDALLEIETDKVNMEVESPADGTLLRRYFEDGDTVPVVTVIGYVGAAGEAVPDGPSTAGAPQAAPQAPKEEKPAAYEFDAAVIGGGPAGYVAAIRAAQLGGRVVLFERDVGGGAWLGRGCMRRKSYLKAAGCLRHIGGAAKRGIVLESGGVAVDMNKVHAYKQTVVKKLTGGVAMLLKSRGIETVRGDARLTDAHTVTCAGKSYTAGSILLCGGSRAGTVPIPGIDSPRVVTSDGILSLTELPGRLAVIGGGVIGCEIATAFAAFGSEVTVVELMDRPVPMMDGEVSAAIAAAMKKDGVRLLLGAQVERIEDLDAAVRVHVAGHEPVEADLVLLSVGRSADLTCLGELAGEIEVQRGKVVVDALCRTNIPGVYACGDVTAVSALAHSAFKMGEAAAANALGGRVEADLARVPSCLYTMPEAACVGMTEEEAGGKHQLLVGRFPFSANGRALASGEPEGFVKVIAEKRHGEILGVHIVGAAATEMIAEAKVLMDMEITIHEAADVMHAHPTFSEALMEACADALGRCIHLPGKA